MSVAHLTAAPLPVALSPAETRPDLTSAVANAITLPGNIDVGMEWHSPYISITLAAQGEDHRLDTAVWTVFKNSIIGEERDSSEIFTLTMKLTAEDRWEIASALETGPIPFTLSGMKQPDIALNWLRRLIDGEHWDLVSLIDPASDD